MGEKLKVKIPSYNEWLSLLNKEANGYLVIPQNMTNILGVAYRATKKYIIKALDRPTDSTDTAPKMPELQEIKNEWAVQGAPEYPERAEYEMIEWTYNFITKALSTPDSPEGLCPKCDGAGEYIKENGDCAVCTKCNGTGNASEGEG